MEDILVCGRKTIFTREFFGSRLDRLWVFRDKKGGDGVSEDQLNGLRWE
jgi:hypothetical protein